VKQADSTALVLGPSDFTLGGWVGNTSQQNGLWAGQYYLQQMAAYDQAHGQRILDYFDEHYYFQFSTPAEQLASTRTLWDPTYNGGTWVEQYDFDGPMQLIPRFRNWISTYYPGTLLSISEYSIDSGQKLITDALAEMDVLGIFGREPLDFANMWTPPGPQDPIAFAFRMFRNYDGNGSQFGDTSISAVSTDQGQLSVYAAQRSSDNAVTILAINKTTAAISSTLSLANLNLPSTAQVYTYAQTNLTSIVHGSDTAISNGSISYTFPAYSAVEFVVQPAAAALITTTTTLTSSATQITAGQSITFNVAVAAASGSTPAGNATLLDGTTTIGTAALANGAATFTIPSLAAGSHNITASYAGSSTDDASVSSALTIQVNAGSLQTTTVTLATTPTTAAAGQTVSMTATVTPASATGTVTFKDGGTTIGSSSLNSGSATLSLATLSVGVHTLAAVYGGDANNSSSTSASITVTITAATTPLQATTITLTAASSTVVSGQAIGLTANVTPASAGGTVTFKDGGTSIGSSTLAAGSATLSLNTLSVGTHSLTAVYAGDAGDSGSTSAAITVTVTAASAPPSAADYTLSLSSSTLSMTQDKSGSLTVSVAPQNGFNSSLSFACTGLPTGWGCTFAPATLSGSGPESTVMTISPTPTGMVMAIAWPVILLGWAAKRRRRLLLCSLLLLSGCGASFTNTPATTGTYNVTVTASGQSAPTHTQAFTLTLTQ
jgi:hypothetical protein